MKITDKAVCCGCGACAEICPKHCIQMAEDSEGFRYPAVDDVLCVSCGLCEKACPMVQYAPESSAEPHAYAVKNKDESVRCDSSSGGMFSLLAEHVLSDGGVVVGAAFTEDFRGVQHRIVASPDAIHTLRRSKYVQSDTTEIHRLVKAELEKGKKVLFTGTPCQCESLLSFLGKRDENLILTDIICHGVPSPKLWRKYVDYRQAQHESKLTEVRFRDKQSGWQNCDFAMDFGPEEYRCSNRDDPYIQMFLQDLCLRPSCHACKFKKFNRQSDLTMADFWGIDEILPEINDDKGISLVFAHNPTGMALIKALEDKMEIYPVDPQKAIANNRAMICPYAPHPKRAAFFEHMDKVSFDTLFNKYAKRKLTPKRIVKGVLRRLRLLDRS